MFSTAGGPEPSQLDRIPSAKIVFVCGNGDLSFCDPAFAAEIIAAVRRKNARCPDKTYYFQSKAPACFAEVLHTLPGNAVVLTTLETNRDKDYDRYSKAPPPSERYEQFRGLDYPRKVVTIEPVMDFDVDIFAEWIISLRPEYVWLGYNSRPAEARLPEPSAGKLRAFIRMLTKAGVSIRPKDLRGMRLGLSASCGMPGDHA